jgi:hypothetical protein
MAGCGDDDGRFGHPVRALGGSGRLVERNVGVVALGRSCDGRLPDVQDRVDVLVIVEESGSLGLGWFPTVR